MDYKMQALMVSKGPESPDFWPQAIAILSEAPTEMELDSHIIHLAGILPGIPDVGLAQKSLRREVNKVRRAHAAKEAGRAVPHVSAPQLSQKMNSAEMVVFLAFLSMQFRVVGWMFARAKELFETPQAIRISEAIANVFPVSAPEGEPARWLHRFEDDGLRQDLSDLLSDIRANNLTETYISDTVERLRQKQQKRKNAEIRKGGLDSAKRQEILMRLREQKPDRLKKQQDDDNLF